MNAQEAAQRLAAFLNELDTEGIRVETGAFGALCLSTDADGHVGNVWPPAWPPGSKDAVWRVGRL